MNMKVTFNIGAAVAFSLLACSSSSKDSGTGSAEIDEAKAKQTAGTIVPGTIGATSKIDEGEEHRWVVAVQTAGGGSVDVELSRATGALEELKSEKGPFEYEIAAPISGYLSYSAAKAKALATKAGKVEVWELDVGKTQWEFYVRDSNEHLFEIKMSADKGVITTVEEKAKPD
jgi:uncharacterized membrane protein YkoI